MYDFKIKHKSKINKKLEENTCNTLSKQKKLICLIYYGAIKEK